MRINSPAARDTPPPDRFCGPPFTKAVWRRQHVRRGGLQVQRGGQTCAPPDLSIRAGSSSYDSDGALLATRPPRSSESRFGGRACVRIAPALWGRQVCNFRDAGWRNVWPSVSCGGPTLRCHKTNYERGGLWMLWGDVEVSAGFIHLSRGLPQYPT